MKNIRFYNFLLLYYNIFICFWHQDKWLNKMSCGIFFSQLALYSPYMLDGIKEQSHLGLELSLWNLVTLTVPFLSWLFLLTTLFLDGRTDLTLCVLFFFFVVIIVIWLIMPAMSRRLWQLIFKSWNVHASTPFLLWAHGEWEFSPFILHLTWG